MPTPWPCRQASRLPGPCLQRQRALFSCHPAARLALKCTSCPQDRHLRSMLCTESRAQPSACCPPACLACAAVLAAINVAFHLGRLVLGVTLEQAMDAKWVIRPAVSGAKNGGGEERVEVGISTPHRSTCRRLCRSAKQRVWIWCVHICSPPYLAGAASYHSVPVEKPCGKMWVLVHAWSRPCIPAASGRPPSCVQEGTQKFWELWELFNISDLSFRCLPWPAPLCCPQEA